MYKKKQITIQVVFASHFHKHILQRPEVFKPKTKQTKDNDNGFDIYVYTDMSYVYTRAFLCLTSYAPDMYRP